MGQGARRRRRPRARRRGGGDAGAVRLAALVGRRRHPRRARAHGAHARRSAPPSVTSSSGPGGIREVEFFTQALQLVHGGRNPSLRERGTLRALDRLRTAGIVSEREHRALADAYLFLRRVEHRLQLAEGRQTHALPADADGEALLRATARIRRSRAALTRRWRRRDGSVSRHLRHARRARRRRRRRRWRRCSIRRRRARRSSAALRRARLPQRRGVGRRDGAPARQAAVAVRAGARAATCARVLLEEAAASPDPDLALRRLNDLVGRRGAGADHLAARRRAPRRWRACWSRSSAPASSSARRWWRIPSSSSRCSRRRRRRACARAQEIDDLVARAQDGLAADDEEARLNALRRVRNEEMLRVGLFDVGGELTPAEVSAQLTDLADATLEAALAVVAPPTFAQVGHAVGVAGGARPRQARRARADLLVRSRRRLRLQRRGAGRRRARRHQLRGDVAAGAAAHPRAVGAISTRGGSTRSTRGCARRGRRARWSRRWRAFAPITPRRRRCGSGRRSSRRAPSPAIARSAREIERLAEAHVYQRRQRRSRAAHGGGDRPRCARAWRRRSRRRRRTSSTSRPGAAASSTSSSSCSTCSSCTGRGCRRCASAPPPTRSPRSRATGILAADEARALAESYAFLRRLENRLRIVHDRSIQQITDRADELGTLARRLGYHGDDGGARLLADYRAHTERIRALYAR